jgi:phage shock protein C
MVHLIGPDPNAFQKQGSEDMTRLTLDKTNKKILGVCAGLANWSGIDAMIIRLIFSVATVVGFGSPVLIYILLAMILD